MKAAVLVLVSTTLFAEVLPQVAPEKTGLAAERLTRITKLMNEHVEANHISGGVGFIARRGQAGYFETYGFQDRENKKPMRKDSIFRIYSMTKAVTGVAVMMLYEEGKFFLTDPVSKYLPEYKNMKVSVFGNPVAAERQMTIRDLLRHTAGFDYSNYGLIEGTDLAGFSQKLAQKPLIHQPGTTFHYSVSIDIAGRLVEVLSGQPLDQFFDERIFRPLGLKDTAFYVPQEKWDRLVVLDAPADAGTVKRSTAAPQDSFKTKPKFFSGGGGLVSTTMDYARFCQMMLDGGQLDGKRILGRKTVELMSTDHLGNLGVVGGGGSVSPGYGFGLTFAVNQDPGKAGAVGSKGEYNWGGAAGTRFWIDPKEQMVGVFMVNILPHTGLTYGQMFKQLAYQAIVD